MPKINLCAEIQPSQIGQRLDQALAECFPDYSRSRLKLWIENNCVFLNGNIANIPRTKVYGQEKIEIHAQIEEEKKFIAENIALNIVYQDADIIVINKPKQLVVHPGAGNASGTILNALLHHFPQLSLIPRAGIVHRLDKDTTGLMVVAKTITAQTQLVRDLQQRNIIREYEAIATGIMTKGGKIDQPISRHPSKRTHMAVNALGKPAVTHYRIMENFRGYTRLRLRLETGRTHQIRVHLSHLAHPLLGDQTYGGRLRLPKGASEELLAVLRNFQHQALHAIMLRLPHPIHGEIMEWQAPLPEDFAVLVDALKIDYLLHQPQLNY